MSSLKRDRDNNDDVDGKRQKPSISSTQEEKNKEKQAVIEAAERAQNGGDYVNPKDGKTEFAVFKPDFLNMSIDGKPLLHDKIKDMLKLLFHIEERFSKSACDQTFVNDALIVYMIHKYGKEFYVQTEEFARRCREAKAKYSRGPADSRKHSIPVDTTPWLERHILLEPLRELCAYLEQEGLIDGEKLCLVQCVYYEAEKKSDRGRHIDNGANTGKIIVGVTLGDKPLEECKDETARHRSITLDRNGISFTKVLPPGSVYVMKGECRDFYYHDAKKPAGSSHYVIMLRYGDEDDKSTNVN